MRSLLLLIILAFTPARDDGRWAGEPLKPWFDKLTSQRGLCCSFADGVMVEDVDWDMAGKTGDMCLPVVPNGPRLCADQYSGYRVRLNKRWVEVPATAVISEPNRAKVAVVWPWLDMNGETQIRCFLPGPGA